MTTTVRRKLIAFVVLSVVGITFISFRYVGADRLVGLGPYTVTLQMRESGGIFPAASVSYRGVEIGQVGAMRVTPTGLETDIQIEKDAPDVPASSIAVIANRSAVGEQYVDLQPPRDGGPFLQEGDVIPPDRIRTPVPVEELLASVNGLATSVPLPELQTTVDELFNAFDRAGPSLQRLLDSSNVLVDAAIENLPQTRALLRDGRIALSTQASLGPQILSFSRDLNLFTAQLKADDPNLRRLVRAAPPAARELEALIRETGPDLSRTLRNLLVVTRIVQPRLAGVEQLLVTYPALSAAAPAVVPGDGRVHFGVVLNLNDPPYCRNGYLQPDGDGDPATTWQRADAPPVGGGGPDGFFDLNTSVFCNEDFPVNPRGAQHTPNPDGSERSGLLNPNETYAAPGQIQPGVGDGAPNSDAYLASGGPGGNGQDTPSQNESRTTAFQAVPQNPADVLRDSDPEEPPAVIIPGLGS